MKLALVHAGIDPFLGKQFFVGSLFGNSAVVDDDDPVGIGDG